MFCFFFKWKRRAGAELIYSFLSSSFLFAFLTEIQVREILSVSIYSTRYVNKRVYFFGWRCFMPLMVHPTSPCCMLFNKYLLLEPSSRQLLSSIQYTPALQIRPSIHPLEVPDTCVWVYLPAGPRKQFWPEFLFLTGVSELWASVLFAFACQRETKSWCALDQQLRNAT